MAEAKIKIKGIAPLLMHRFTGAESEEEKAKRTDEKFIPEEEAEKALYRNSKKEIYLPSAWIEGCLRDAAKEFKGKGRATLKATVLSTVFVQPDEILLHKQKYDEIDRRPVVIQRQRIVRSRPKFNSWEVEFTIQFDEARVKKDTLKQILEEAGRTKGIGDYRPKFGRFDIVEFK